MHSGGARPTLPVSKTCSLLSWRARPRPILCSFFRKRLLTFLKEIQNITKHSVSSAREIHSIPANFRGCWIQGLAGISAGSGPNRTPDSVQPHTRRSLLIQTHSIHSTLAFSLVKMVDTEFSRLGILTRDKPPPRAKKTLRNCGAHRDTFRNGNSIVYIAPTAEILLCRQSTLPAPLFFTIFRTKFTENWP